MEKPYVIGIDMGGTNTKFGIVDARGNVLNSSSIKTQQYTDINEYCDVLCAEMMKLVNVHGGIDVIRGVGAGAPNANYYSGNIENAANLPWKGIIPLAAMLRDRVGLAVALANDAHITALGEKTYGSAHGMKDFIVVSISHGGLGSCFFSNGQPHLGFGGFAGELGHTCVEKDGRQCGCGNKGCLETYCSDNGLKMTIEELMAENKKENTILKDLKELTTVSVAKCCEQGDKLAQEAFRRVGTMLGLGLANYASIVNPEAIILTGDILTAGKWLLKPMRQSFDEHVFPNIRTNTRILVSILKEGERDVLGASALAWDAKEYSLFK